MIAFVQNKRYKADSDESLEKQYQFEISKLILNGRTSFVQDAKIQFIAFFEKYDIRELIIKMKEVSVLSNPRVKTVQQSELEFEIDYYFKTVESRCKQLIDMVQQDKISSEEKDAVIQTLRKFSEECDKFGLDGYKFIEKCVSPIFDELVNYVWSYHYFLETDIDSSIKRIRDYSYIVEHYGML